KSETRSDVITPGLLERFCATLDMPVTGDIPQGLHWCLGLPDAATADLGADGHPARGGFLPPIPLPRRMWASSNLSFGHPLQIGDAISRISTIASIEEKAGKSGDLAFVGIDHETSVAGRLAIRERQNIVYREPAATAAATRPDGTETADLSEWDWQRRFKPSEPLLFRYSALTFNSHRIHYDRPYAVQEEGYPELVVQGPLMATLLLNRAAGELGADRLSSFSFRGQAPAFADDALTLVGRRNGEGMETAVLSDRGN
ncbi:unnamed protein product, partial [Laminaria digitata]